ncbi:16S rRNA (guanine(527)-N(7))-methyltransferase RsmG [Cognatishimia sp. F0-27]|uniref:16S rRNA (guanine(527)-N(7))-methyltransferase RsmG n=1 Tax=Cognatishimia sp. F0-27 TaxID=2816855 RepID=UPI001D0C0214|nr:16S rRNA (guanine(527)-N(7))-methyltransferase RsmG [Cognatishimia sp. F0-27]MCC1492454.1 16S rRNA (guanine(527)-N(7))-methyltransferase RsmG [Cognatishimia sp. F0-27]
MNVSRETSERLEHVLALLNRWNPTINLVSKASLSDARERHIKDSMQVFDHAPSKPTNWVDLGTGGGFPGLVCAILALEKSPEIRFTFVESDTRKCTFLRTAIRETGVQATVLSRRIEDLEPLNADVVTARALAPLTTLLRYADRHMLKTGRGLFPKGKSWREECNEAKESWRFEMQSHKSKTNADAVILEIWNLEHL